MENPRTRVTPTYRLEVTVADPLDANGVVIDLDSLEEIVRPEVVERFDHRNLNELLDNPSAELIGQRARNLSVGAGPAPASLRLWETDECSVELSAGTGP